jgi:hypothetical protein
MNILIYIISFLLFCGILIFPFLTLHKLNKKKVKYQFIVYTIFGIVLGTVIIFVFSWWTTTSDEMLLSHYGYVFDSLNKTERYANVLPENINQVKNIETSLSGIGWPLKAIFAFFFYLPYLFIIYFVNYIIKNKKATV